MHLYSQKSSSSTTQQHLSEVCSPADSTTLGSTCSTIRSFGPTVVAIGKFDGMHLGHFELIDRVKKEAREHGWQAGLVTFDRHPNEVLKELNHAYLSSPSERKEICRQAGLDFVLLLECTLDLFATEARDFASTLIRALGSRVIVVGANFRFGKGARGDTRLLRNVARQHGAEVVVMDLKKSCNAVVSSTNIRDALAAGQIEKAVRLLGRPLSRGGTLAHQTSSGLIVHIEPNIALPRLGKYQALLHCREMRISAVAVLEPPIHKEHCDRIHLHQLDRSCRDLRAGEACELVLLRELR